MKVLLEHKPISDLVTLDRLDRLGRLGHRKNLIKDRLDPFLSREFQHGIPRSKNLQLHKHSIYT